MKATGRPFSFLIRAGVSGVLVILLFQMIKAGDIFSLVGRVRMPLFFYALILFTIAQAMSAVKWQFLLRAIGVRERFRSIFRLHLTGIFYTAFLPGGQMMGEAMKTWRASAHLGRTPEIISSVVVDRLTGAAACVLLGFTAFAVAPPGREARALFFIFFLLAAILVVALLLFSPMLFSFCEASVRALPRRRGFVWLGRGARYVGNMMRPYVGAYAALLRAVFFGAALQAINVWVIVILAKSIGIDISFLALLWIYGLVSMILFIPASIMGIGQREVSFVYLLGLIGVAPIQAAGLSLMVLLSVIFLAVFGGGIELWRLWKS